MTDAGQGRAVTGASAARVVAGVALAIAARPAVVAAEPPRVDLRLDGGTEYDTNVHRLEQDDTAGGADVEAAPAARLGARGRLAWRRAAGERLRLLGHGQLKLFASPEAQSENVLALAGEGGWERGIGRRGAAVGLLASYYDAIGLEVAASDRLYPSRTFRTGAGEAQLALAEDGGQRVTAGLGYRVFRYKASPLYDWDGPSLAAGWHTTVWRGDPDVDPDAASLDLGARYRLERRGFDTTALTRPCPDDAAPSMSCYAATDLGRADLHHAVALEAVWTGTRVYTARYELQVNDSNSHGESLVRQRLELAATAELASTLHLTVEGALLYNVFLDGLLVARDVQDQTFVSIDDENRNSLTALLAWRMATATALEARYAIYSDELATDRLAFRRQTMYLGVVHEL